MADSVCQRFGHKYFVADVAVVTAEGRVVILALCTSCGAFLSHSEQVTKGNIEITNLQPNKKIEKE